MPRHSIIAEVRVDPAIARICSTRWTPIFDEVEQEHDTLVYAVHVDLDDPGTVWIYEQYTDREAFDRHQASAAFEQVVRAIAGFVEPGSVIRQAEVVRAKGDGPA